MAKMDPDACLKCLSYLVAHGKMDNLNKLKADHYVFPISKFDHFFTEHTSKILKYFYGEIIEVFTEKGEYYKIAYHMLVIDILVEETCIFSISEQTKEHLIIEMIKNYDLFLDKMSDIFDSTKLEIFVFLAYSKNRKQLNKNEEFIKLADPKLE